MADPLRLLLGGINGWSLSKRKVESRGICGATSGTGGAVSSSWPPPFRRRKKLLLFLSPGFWAFLVSPPNDMMADSRREELLLEGGLGSVASGAGASISCHSSARALSRAKFWRNWARWSSFPSKTPGLFERRLRRCSRPKEDGGLRAASREKRLEEGGGAARVEEEDVDSEEDERSEINGGGTYRIGIGGEEGRWEGERAWDPSPEEEAIGARWGKEEQRFGQQEERGRMRNVDQGEGKASKKSSCAKGRKRRRERK